MRVVLGAGIVSLIALLWSCGSGGSSGPVDPNAPRSLNILYCRVVESNYQVHVQWAANHSNTGEIRYGQMNYTAVQSDPVFADTHDVVLVGLAYSTRYLYRLIVRDSLHNSEECLGEFTTPVKTFPEPILSGLTISEITESSARITWLTDELASTILYYGSPSLTDSTVNGALSTNHAVVLTNLQSSLTYRIRPAGVDGEGYRGYGTETAFTTAARLTLSMGDTIITVGDTLDMSVRIADAQDLAALQYRISFAPALLDIIDLVEGPFFTDRGGFAFFRSIRNGAGEFSNHMTWTILFDGDERQGTQADGSGVVARARLRAVDTGSVRATFDPDSSFGLDMYARVRSCSLRAGIIEVRPQ